VDNLAALKSFDFSLEGGLSVPFYMPDLTNPRLIYLKGFAFLLAGLLAAATILIDHPQWRTAVLLILAIWCFCRFYYFVFYVIERYVDREFKFAGLLAFARYLFAQNLVIHRRGAENAEKTWKNF
jgi:hypothetical protein